MKLFKYQNIMKKIYKFIQNYRYKKAIKQANKWQKLTNRKYIVLLYKGKFIIKTKGDFKKLIRLKYFNGIKSITELEKIAAYVTH